MCSRQWYENLSICNVAWRWIQCNSQLTPFWRLMTSDRSRATRETILIVSERKLHWHIPPLTANAFCFRSDSRTAMNFIIWFFTYKWTSQQHVYNIRILIKCSLIHRNCSSSIQRCRRSNVTEEVIWTIKWLDINVSFEKSYRLILLVLWHFNYIIQNMVCLSEKEAT